MEEVHSSGENTLTLARSGPSYTKADDCQHSKSKTFNSPQFINQKRKGSENPEIKSDSHQDFENDPSTRGNPIKRVRMQSPKRGNTPGVPAHSSDNPIIIEDEDIACH
ncbi:hypothetical protein T310_9650, partial [Rasamsonia emersonii CBS 393.64]